MTIERDHRPLTVAGAGAVARQLDEKQCGLDDGPCVRER
jgi:hypothetical protein